MIEALLVIVIIELGILIFGVHQSNSVLSAFYERVYNYFWYKKEGVTAHEVEDILTKNK
jgi:hypothetical protein